MTGKFATEGGSGDLLDYSSYGGSSQNEGMGLSLDPHDSSTTYMHVRHSILQLRP
jgi:hypothetical protein